MDGFHTPMAALRQRPNSVDVIYRRGAPDTFDTDIFHTALGEIKQGSSDDIKWPSFDHEVGDPKADAILIHRQKHRIVIVEGLYVMLDSHGWEGTPDLFDY